MKYAICVLISLTALSGPKQFVNGQEPKATKTDGLKAEPKKDPEGFDRLRVKQGRTGIEVSIVLPRTNKSNPAAKSEAGIRHSGDMGKGLHWALVVNDTTFKGSVNYPKTAKEDYEKTKGMSREYVISEAKSIKSGDFEGLEFSGVSRFDKKRTFTSCAFVVKDISIGLFLNDLEGNSPELVQRIRNSLQIKQLEPEKPKVISINVPLDKWELLTHEKSGISVRVPSKPKVFLDETRNLSFRCLEAFLFQCLYELKKDDMSYHRALHQERLEKLKKARFDPKLTNVTIPGFAGQMWRSGTSNEVHYLHFVAFSDTAYVNMTADLTKVSEEEAMFFFKSLAAKK
jgi:hypothetical protein